MSYFEKFANTAKPKPRTWDRADALILLGGALVVAGAALVYVPAALILGGAGLVAVVIVTGRTR